MASLVVKCTWGSERPEALLQAFTVAATAASSGVDVQLWLTGEATLHALIGADDVHLPHSPALSELRDIVLEHGSITVCAQCALRRDITQADLLPGVRIAGSTAFVEATMADGARALVY